MYNLIEIWLYVLMCICIVLIVLFLTLKAYMRIRYPFWSIQPVFHIYNIWYWLKPNQTILNEITSSFYGSKTTISQYINKYIKYIDEVNIHTFKEDELTGEVKTKTTEFIQTNFLNNELTKYHPNQGEIFDYLLSHSKQYPSYISFFYRSNSLLSGTNSPIDGMITSRLLYMTFISTKTHTNDNINCLPLYYVDNLCVDTLHRKQGIAPKLIQTHYFHLLNKITTKQSPICLFKKEGTMTPIVPLTTYKTFGFNISLQIIPQKSIPIPIPPTYHLLRLHSNPNHIQIFSLV